MSQEEDISWAYHDQPGFASRMFRCIMAKSRRQVSCVQNKENIRKRDAFLKFQPLFRNLNVNKQSVYLFHINISR